MKNLMVLAAVVALATSAASAQQAVQWRIEDGGNGHWYQWVGYGEFATWGDVSNHASSRGGHLATVTSEPEEQFIRSLFSDGSCSSCPGSSIFVGGYQDGSAADYTEPGGGWRWVTGEAWTYTSWYPNEPNNAGAEDFLVLRCPGGWNDGSSVMGCSVAAVIEWSADCNGDGIVDYGQCRDGSLPDYNGNNIPDCCEAGAPCTVGNYPVQWRVEDGGNGHWYLVSTTPRTFANARDWTHSHGATLALIDSASENEFLFHLTLNTTGPWVGKGPFFGLFQDASSPDFSEPSGGWRWVDGKGVTERFSAFCGGQPDNAHTGQQLGVYWAPGGNPGSCWDDDVSVEELDIVAGPHLIEWSADCNGDGIVDYGQCRDGSLPDYNLNNIPDCCENGTPCTVGRYPVQWRVEDGGNGHWYQVYLLSPMGLDWADAESHAVDHGGHLASITSAAENDHILRIVKPSGPDLKTFWIGGYRSNASCSAPSCFEWTSGEPWGFTSWGPGGPPFDSWGCWHPQPNYCGWGGLGSGLAVEFVVWSDGTQGLWNDEMPNLIGTGAAGAPHVVEWSADCNSDGIVDYGQILLGQLVDANNNGVPDSCEVDPCPADTNNSGAVNGVDLAIVLGAWGTNGQGDGDADINNDGIVNGVDLAMVLAGWGPCP